MVTMNHWVRYFLLGLWITVFAASPGLGQTTFGSITGTVSDPSGSAVPNASVTVKNEARGTTREETTGSTGVFNVPNLDVGTYRLSIAAKGFETYVRAGLDLTAHQVINLNVALVLGSTGTVVTVVAASPIIDTSNATLSSVVTGYSMQELPLVSRQHGDAGFYDIMLLNPGTAQVPSNGAGPVINGTHQAAGQLVAIDGIALWRNTSGYGAGEEQPSFEAAQEVHVITSDAPAEYASPVATTEVTKGGSNAFHGGAFEAYNSNILNARDFFGVTAATRVFNDFGATLGGPIRKNKTFFYFAFEGARTGGLSPLTASVPPAAWREGDFSSLSTVIKNPATGAAFTNNTVPSNLISSVSQKMDNYIYPLPNFGSSTLVANNFRGNYPNIGTTNWDVYNARVDHNFGSHDTIFGRFSTRKIPQVHVIDVPTIGDELQIRTALSSVFSWTHLFSPTLFNEFRAGYIRGRNHITSNQIGSSMLQQFGIEGVSTSGIAAVPVLSITSLTTTTESLQDTHEDNFEYLDDVVWNRGKHFMKFGFDAVRDRPGGLKLPGTVYGQYNFTGVYSGLGFADFLLGIPQTTSLTVLTPPRYLLGTVWGMYAQDQYKVNAKLTLNYGVRWDIQPPYHDKHGAIYNFNPANGDLIVPNGAQPINPFFPTNIPIESAPQANYPGTSLINSHYNYIFPRIGFAYSPSLSGKMVIRGGYGIYSNLPFANLAVGMTGGPFSGSTTYRNSLTNGVPLFSFPDPFLASGTTATQSVHGDLPNMRLPYTQQWNVTAERQIGGIGLELAYVGTHSVDLYYERNLDQPMPSTTPFTSSREAYPLYSAADLVDSGGTMDFNSLDMSATKRYGKNITFNTGWAWARDLTDVGNSTSIAGYLIQNPYNRRAERGNDADTPASRWFGYALYALPVGQGQRFLSNANSVVQAFLGGWNTSWNAGFQSGTFFTPAFSSYDTANTGVFGGRPDRVPGVPVVPAGGRTVNGWFNPAAFKIPGCPDAQSTCMNPADIGRFGDAGVDSLVGPHIINFDFSLRKNFKIRENVLLEFRLNMVNAFNHPNFSTPDPNISDLSTVGTISSTATATGLGEPVPREIDLWLRLSF